MKSERLPDSMKARCVMTAVVILGALLAWTFGWLPVANLTLLILFAGLLAALTALPIPLLAHIPLWLVTVLVGFAAAVYRPEGFHYPLVWDFGALHEGGAPFKLFANISKGFGGLLVIIWLCYSTRGRLPSRPWGASLAAATLGIGAMLAAAHWLFGFDVALKLPAGLVYFAAVNLCITVMAEEAFFRLLLQDKISAMGGHAPWVRLLAVFVASVVFTLALTTQPGPAFVLFFTAGLLYSGIYWYTRRFSIALYLHFSVNIAHIILLEYPAPV